MQFWATGPPAEEVYQTSFLLPVTKWFHPSITASRTHCCFGCTRSRHLEHAAALALCFSIIKEVTRTSCYSLCEHNADFLHAAGRGRRRQSRDRGKFISFSLVSKTALHPTLVVLKILLSTLKELKVLAYRQKHLNPISLCRISLQYKNNYID